MLNGHHEVQGGGHVHQDGVRAGDNGDAVSSRLDEIEIHTASLCHTSWKSAPVVYRIPQGTARRKSGNGALIL